MNQNFGLDVKRRPKHMSKQIFWIIFYKTHFCSKFPRRREYLEAYNWRAFRGQQYCLNWQNIYLALYFFMRGEFTFLILRVRGVRVQQWQIIWYKILKVLPKMIKAIFFCFENFYGFCLTDFFQHYLYNHYYYT